MSENKYKFEKLTPTDNVELDVYEEAINYVFDNTDIKNVAISGAYSAGKSSLLASYKKKHTNLKFLHISLAHFISPEQSEQDIERNVKESVLEGKILNHLIHQIPADKIPQTNFKVKKSLDFKDIIRETMGCIMLVITISFFACFDLWKDFVNALPDSNFKLGLTSLTHPYALMVDGVLIITLLSYFIYKLLVIQKNKNIFRKLNIQGNEIEIFEESEESYFDKYLNEVLYLFENSNADVIVFEDMDRFNANRIFERLREINTLVNIQLAKNDKELRFFYLLRDDIFVSKDRTKFFDYIIPVVPVVDSSNSYNQIISHLKNGGVLDRFNENFLQGLSLYIDDMRLLKNIYNEFLIYYNRLNTIELDCNKMFAIITYKNLFPRDYSDLQLNRGFVYVLFAKKEHFIENEIICLSDRIAEIKNNIEKVNKEHLISIKELDTVFEAKRRTGYGNRELKAEEKKELENRKKYIEEKNNGNISEMEEEISNLENKKILIQNKQLSEIITRDNVDAIFGITDKNEIGEEITFNEIKSSEYFDLLKYLIWNGYIDETYADYMTYFYDNSLSRIDKTFLRSITDKKSKEYAYKLNNPQLVLSYLRLVDFDQEEILNFDLLTYLLQSSSSIEYLERFIDQIKKTKNFCFIGAYYDVTTELSAFIKNLNQSWPQIFVTVLNEQSLTVKQIRRYAIDTIYYSDDDVIKSMNENNCFSDYITNARDFLNINNPDINRLIHCFKILGVCFKGFEYSELNKPLFLAVYEESMYELNSENIRLIQREVLNEISQEDVLHKNYTLLCDNEESAITKYVNENINEYFDEIFGICDNSINDDENVAITVLNNPDLSLNRKETYISVLRTEISSIREITDSSLWSSLLDADIVKYSECNVMGCFLAINLNESVISYINRINIVLDFTTVEYDYSDKKALFDNVVKCMSINSDKYTQILVSLGLSYDEFEIANISSEKMAILISENIIEMTAKNLVFIRENYPEQHLMFVRNNIEKYIDIMDDDLFLQDELLEVLNWDISDELKIRLIEFSDVDISVVDKNYPSAVCIYILKNNLKKGDLQALFIGYETWNEDIQNEIFELATQNIEQIIDKPISASEKLKKRLISSDKVARNEKIDLFIAMIPYHNVVLIKEILSLLNLTDFLKIFDMHSRPKFKNDDENVRLLEAFKSKGIIDNYEDSDKEGYYKIIRSKSRTM